MKCVLRVNFPREEPAVLEFADMMMEMLVALGDDNSVMPYAMANLSF